MERDRLLVEAIDLPLPTRYQAKAQPAAGQWYTNPKHKELGSCRTASRTSERSSACTFLRLMRATKL